MITLTKIAATKMQAALDNRKKGLGMRVGVRTTGCSGLSYVLEYVDMPTEHDIRFVSHGVNIFVDPKSLVYIDGLEMDWARNGLNEGFEFHNPNTKAECGCGESFTV